MILRLALRRLRSRPQLTVLLLIGLALAAAIPASIPVYANGATTRILNNQQFDETNRPPFTYLFWYSAALAEPVGWEDVKELDAYMGRNGFPDLGLPVQWSTSYLDTKRFELRQPDGGESYGGRPIATLGNFSELASVVEGRLPVEGGVNDEGTIEIVLSVTTASEAGIVVGDILEVADYVSEEEGGLAPIEVEVVGLWVPADETDSRWIMAPSRLEQRIFVDKAVITDVLSPQRVDVVETAAFFTQLDAGTLSTEKVGGLLSRASVVTRQASSLLPGVERVNDPVDGLARFRDRADTLSKRLRAYAIPTLGLITIFVLLIVSLITDERRHELAVLHSRGASRRQLLAQVGVEAGLVSVGALVLGVPLSLGLAKMIGNAETFLRLGAVGDISINLTSSAWRIAVFVVVVAMVFQIIPAISAAGATVVTHDEMMTRGVRQPWWQRSKLDLFVIFFVVVATYQILQREPDPSTGILEDPVIILLPAMAALAVGLAVLRLLPIVLGIATQFLARTNSIVGLVATRQAARSPGNTSLPLLLLVVTVSSAIFTASLARTLDLQLLDETYHAIGADLMVLEADSATEPNINGMTADDAIPRVLIPTDELEQLPNINRATRVGSYPTMIRSDTGVRHDVVFFGVDADSFSEIAFYRDDYTDALSMPELMLLLEATPEAILADPRLGLNVGDVWDAALSIQGETVRTQLVVAGTIRQFPTWYADGEDSDPIVVGNLDLIFEQSDEPMGYQLWLDIEQDSDAAVSAMLGDRLRLLDSAGVAPQVSLEQALPERQGVFGLLTVGFIASIFISMLGFFFTTLFKVRRSTVELGTLQALGLTPRQVAGVIVLELGLVTATGLVAGLVSGQFIAARFIVRLVGDSGLTATPELLPEIDPTAVYTVSALLGVLFVVSAIALVAVLRQMKVFEALKMGETR